MPRNHSARLAVITGLAVVLAGCGSNEAEIKQYAKRKGMNEIQTAAFSTCAKDLTRNKPIFPVADGYMVMKDVPFDVCACQATTMMAVFKEKKYKSHTAFSEYMATYGKKKKPHIRKVDLVRGLKPGAVRIQLEASLQSCTTAYVDAHKKQSAELYKIEPMKKKKEKKKKAEAKSS